jgi:hypothetical protein
LPAIGGFCRRLDEARELLAAGKPHLAAIAARIVLEQDLAALWTTTGKPLNCRGLVRLVRALTGRGLIALEDRDPLLRVARVANAAAHGRPVEAAAVTELLKVAERVAGEGPEDPSKERNAS